MKTIPPTCPEPESGRKYWRSLDEVADTPEFRQWLEREFPQGASEFADDVSRRHFVKIMSASFMLAGLGLASTGCRRPVEHLEPMGKQPDDYVYGMPRFYSSAMPRRGGAIPLVVKSYEGRPVKIEGNPLHPDSNGGTDRWAQASILNLYDPDRTRRFTKGGNDVSPEAAMDFLAQISKNAEASGGRGLAFLIEASNSPSQQRLLQIINRKFNHAGIFAHDAIDTTDIQEQAASQAFGMRVKPYFKYDAAKVIVSLDCDFIGSEEDAHNNIRRFIDGRRIEEPTDSMNRLYVIEALMTLTGANADHRLRVAASQVGAIARAMLDSVSGAAVAVAGVDPKWIDECARDLAAHKGESLVVAGHRQPLEVHLLAHALNVALGNIGKTVQFHALEGLMLGNISELATLLNAGRIDTLVILGGNPVYTAPADLDWATAQRKAKTVARLGYYEDETFEKCDWHLPLAHYLESWGDARSSDGTLVPVQPLISPLFGGLTAIEVLARIAGESVTSPYEIVRATFAEIGGHGDVPWKKFLFNGFLEESAAKPADVHFDNSSLGKAQSPPMPAPSKDSLEVVFHRDYRVDDGTYNNNGWLQEMPDPITKMVWDNAVLMSRKTASELGVQDSETVEVKLGGRSIRGPVWVQPGMADYTLGLPLGYGRMGRGRIGYGVGFNAYALRTTINKDFSGAGKSIAGGATVTRTGDKYELVGTQTHWSMEGRPIIREANLNQYREHPGFVANMHPETPPVEASMYPNPFDELKKTGHHQWGMAVDLTACVGCSTCMMACQSENNVPIVGKDLVSRGREMHWIRIDRYYSTDPKKRRRLQTFKNDDQQQFEDWIDEVQVVTQPMFCQHCEAAPCESVCPVNATVHDQEGLNLMVYNRCVGTRYCSNNCPYKVRRFNFLDFNKRSLKELKGPRYPGPVLPTTAAERSAVEKWLKDPTDPTAGSRQDDEWDLIKMSKNPDVTVRMRGVMEKCTFCIQRIQQAEIAQKDKAGQSGDITVPDGARSKEVTALKTACQQACPAGALVFGNIADPESRVSKLKAQQRNYSVLDFLLTKPRTTYLAKLRNPNPAMPDAVTPLPYTLAEYEAVNGDPFAEHEESAEKADH